MGRLNRKGIDRLKKNEGSGNAESGGLRVSKQLSKNNLVTRIRAKRSNTMKLTSFLILILLLLTTIFCGFSIANAEVIPILPEQVTVLDGDTIIINTLKNEYRIRLEHIDAPEKYQDFGPEAKQFLQNAVNVQQLYVVVDLKGVTTYNRFMGTLYTQDGRSINKMLVASGLAWWYRKYSSDTSYEAWEEAARRQHMGLWISEYPIAPWMYRKGIKQVDHEPYYKYVAPTL